MQLFVFYNLQEYLQDCFLGFNFNPFYSAGQGFNGGKWILSTAGTELANKRQR